MSPVAQKSSPGPGPGKPTFTGAGTGTEITGIHRDRDPGISLAATQWLEKLLYSYYREEVPQVKLSVYGLFDIVWSA